MGIFIQMLVVHTFNMKFFAFLSITIIIIAFLGKYKTVLYYVNIDKHNCSIYINVF